MLCYHGVIVSSSPNVVLRKHTIGSSLVLALMGSSRLPLSISMSSSIQSFVKNHSMTVAELKWPYWSHLLSKIKEMRC